MKLRMLASLLLGCLFVMTAQGDSSARVIPGQEGNTNKLEMTGITSEYEYDQKEPFELTGATHIRKLGLGGKKLMTHEVTSKDSKNEKGADGGGTSKISGRDKDALKKSFGSSPEQKNDQKKHMTVMGPKASKFTNFVIPRSSSANTNSKCSQDSNAVLVKASLKSSSRSERQISEKSQGTNQKDETQSLVEAAKDIVNLIHMDYHKEMPRRKPPINNHEPRN